MINLLLTGSSGFIGTNAWPILSKEYNLKAFSFLKDEFREELLEGVDGIIYLSGLAHQTDAIDAQKYFVANKEQPIMLATAAKRKNIRSFIYLSSVKVYGDDQKGMLDENSACHPSDPYGRSKFEAEEALLKLADENFHVGIIRPPLVYGPGVKANMKALMNVVIKWPFLPFGNIQNKRSMVYVGNLVALISHLLKKETSGVFIAGDLEPISTTELIRQIKRACKSKSPLISIPKLFQNLITRIKPAIGQRIFGSFIIDNKSTNKRLNFTPPYTFEEGIFQMVNSNTDS